MCQEPFSVCTECYDGTMIKMQVPATILLVEYEQPLSHAMKIKLMNAGYDVTHTDSSRQHSAEDRWIRRRLSNGQWHSEPAITS